MVKMMLKWVAAFVFLMFIKQISATGNGKDTPHEVTRLSYGVKHDMKHDLEVIYNISKYLTTEKGLRYSACLINNERFGDKAASIRASLARLHLNLDKLVDALTLNNFKLQYNARKVQLPGKTDEESINIIKNAISVAHSYFDEFIEENWSQWLGNLSRDIKSTPIVTWFKQRGIDPSSLRAVTLKDVKKWMKHMRGIFEQMLFNFREIHQLSADKRRTMRTSEQICSKNEEAESAPKGDTPTTLQNDVVASKTPERSSPEKVSQLITRGPHCNKKFQYDSSHDSVSVPTNTKVSEESGNPAPVVDNKPMQVNLSPKVILELKEIPFAHTSGQGSKHLNVAAGMPIGYLPSFKRSQPLTSATYYVATDKVSLAVEPETCKKQEKATSIPTKGGHVLDKGKNLVFPKFKGFNKVEKATISGIGGIMSGSDGDEGKNQDAGEKKGAKPDKAQKKNLKQPPADPKEVKDENDGPKTREQTPGSPQVKKQIQDVAKSPIAVQAGPTPETPLEVDSVSPQQTTVDTKSSEDALTEGESKKEPLEVGNFVTEIQDGGKTPEQLEADKKAAVLIPTVTGTEKEILENKKAEQAVEVNSKDVRLELVATAEPVETKEEQVKFSLQTNPVSQEGGEKEPIISEPVKVRSEDISMPETSTVDSSDKDQVQVTKAPEAEITSTQDVNERLKPDEKVNAKPDEAISTTLIDPVEVKTTDKLSGKNEANAKGKKPNNIVKPAVTQPEDVRPAKTATTEAKTATTPTQTATTPPKMVVAPSKRPEESPKDKEKAVEVKTTTGGQDRKEDRTHPVTVPETVVNAPEPTATVVTDPVDGKVTKNMRGKTGKLGTQQEEKTPPGPKEGTAQQMTDSQSDDKGQTQKQEEGPKVESTRTEAADTGSSTEGSKESHSLPVPTSLDYIYNEQTDGRPSQPSNSNVSPVTSLLITVLVYVACV